MTPSLNNFVFEHDDLFWVSDIVTVITDVNHVSILSSSNFLNKFRHISYSSFYHRIESRLKNNVYIKLQVKILIFVLCICKFW